MKLRVNSSQRLAKMRAHSATHILHYFIWQLVPDTKQAWSLVEQDYLRFDFASKNAFSSLELKKIEQQVNEVILNWYEVEISTSSYQQALKSWAKAFFEDKYWDEVRVVKIWDFSIELCGWTHVKNTSDIWSFVIVSQEAVASWIKRIVAYTWPKVYEYICDQRQILENIAQKLETNEKQIIEKLEKTISENKSNISKLQTLESKIISSFFEKDESIFNVDKLDIWFRQILDYVKSKNSSILKIVYKSDGSYGLIWPGAKNFSQQNWLKWGWSENFVQWKDRKILDLIN